MKNSRFKVSFQLESSGLGAVYLRKEKHDRTLLALTSDGAKGTGTLTTDCLPDLLL